MAGVTTHPFDVSVNDATAVEMFQPDCYAKKLPQQSYQDNAYPTVTHKMKSIVTRVFGGEFHDISVFH